jgi:hypothetical protein
MPIEFHVDDNQMSIMRGMMERGDGVRFLRKSDDKKDPQGGEIIATHTDSRGNKWIARRGEKELNSAQKDMARQILEWMAIRG